MMKTKHEIVQELREKGYKTSFKTKQDAQSLLDNILWFQTFPWHEDQKVILDWNIHDKRESVVQGVFGSGKTTVMMGIFSKLLENQQVQASSVLFCAFNVSIRNELKKKLKQTGLKSRPLVRTFDSLIFEFCNHHGMKGLEKPDYEGRRYFIEKLLLRNNPLYQGFFNIHLLLVDETQDLDYKSYQVFKSFFPNAHIFFFGDIFQCIQKEPRSSLLWHVLQPEEERRIHFMQKTPRVPTTILEEIKRALICHYPEYTAPISNWYSSNPLPAQETKIEWIAIKHYNDVFRHLTEFLQKHPPEQCMVLTFSSAITVRGSMGDLSRFRQFLQKNQYVVNKNYKSMDHDKLFLSTVNSSKGLERPYVFIALTFPLELAFANFSNDLVVNLISVGLSRCKTNATFCVPIYSDRFSEVLRLYPECPKPDAISISNKKHVREEEETIQEILHRPHSTTEILRQGILSFSTRELLRSCAKYVGTNPFPQGERVKWSMRNEEEASFMGILYEVLITSLWTQKWPELDIKEMTEILNNPMYKHCRPNIERKFHQLVGIFQKPYYCNFDVLYDYTDYHILLSQKIKVHIAPQRKEEMKSVWNRLRHDVTTMKPIFPNKKPQVNLTRSFTTGIADMICKSGGEEEDENLVLYEIKTCSTSNWKEDAFTQASLYMSMTRNKRGVIRLFNPFRRELYEYNISLMSKEKQVLVQIDRELLLWNFNCFLAKFKDNVLMPPLPHNIKQYVCQHENVSLEFLASTKARLVENDVPLQDDKIIVRLTHQDPLFKDKVEKNTDLVKWLMETIGYSIKEGEVPEMVNDPFYKCILMGVFLRKSFSFR